MIPAWKTKAARVIGELCGESWRKANHDKNGKRYKKHRPYGIALYQKIAIPDDAETLLKCVREDDEETAKALFIRLACKLSKEQVDAGELDNYDPARYDAEFHSDGSITLIPLLWWDDA